MMVQIPGADRTTFVFICLATGLIGLTDGHVAHAAGEAVNEVEEITITARKREESLYETPAAVTALSPDDVKSYNISNLDDVAKYTPNLTISRYGVGNTAQAAVFIRGIGLQDHIITTDPGVGVYLDGIYLGRQMGSNLSLNNIERIEVLRGPQGTLYGRNTLGGAVNIITRKPGDEEAFEFTMKAGSRGRGAVDVYTNYSMSEDVALAFSGGYKRRNGVGIATRLTNPEAQIGEELEINGRLTTLWNLSDSFSLLFSLDGVDSENGQSPYTIEFHPSIPAPDPDDIFAGDFDLLNASLLAADPDDIATTVPGLESTSNKAIGFSVTADFQMNSRFSGMVLASYRESEYTGGLDDDATALRLSEFPETGEADQFSLEFQLNGDFGQSDFVGGLYYFTEDGKTESGPWVFSPFNMPGGLDNAGMPTGFGDFGFFDLNQETTSYAIYANSSFDVSDRLSLGIGGRYSKDDKDANAMFPTFAARKFVSGDWGEFTWDLNATYELNNGNHVYGQLQRGYQTGGYPPRPFGGPDQFTAFDETTAINFEVGYKGAVTDNITLLLSAFWTEYDDLALPFSDTTAGGGFVTIVENAGESRSRGIELEGSIRGSDVFSLNFSLGYLDAEITKVLPQTIGIGQGDAPALTPDLTFSVAPRFAVPMQNGGTLTTQVDYSFRDEMYGQSINNPAELIDSRSLVGFSVDYESPDGSWTLGAYGENIFDEVYDQGRLQQTGFVGVVLSNDRSEFGLRISKRFDGN